MKLIPIIFLLPAVFGLASCAEPLPLKLSVCKDGACVGVETVIPARGSGKEVVEVQ